MLLLSLSGGLLVLRITLIVDVLGLDILNLSRFRLVDRCVVAALGLNLLLLLLLWSIDHL